ncbi:hypothetical protein DPEC_G00032100 [Dallia pectoralis]|uniref:Uncharacterized protein n=1 Tax=Dallia pectoralis TaxID=75939 RepID=A0ACC2HCF1_DALPE|nr:hypothetical protein DPEC_G00032100 [Dallia pectoralis]
MGSLVPHRKQTKHNVSSCSWLNINRRLQRDILRPAEPERSEGGRGRSMESSQMRLHTPLFVPQAHDKMASGVRENCPVCIFYCINFIQWQRSCEEEEGNVWEDAGNRTIKEEIY